MKTKQLSFLTRKTNQRFFGGQLLHGRRKSLRPLARNEAMHFVLRSSYAYGHTSFRRLHNLKAIERILQTAAKKYGVRIYRQAIQSNHVHLILRISNRRLYRAFICVISGKIASQVMQNMSFKNFLKALETGEGSTATAAKLPKPKNGQAFWEHRPFHRIINWGKDFTKCCRYLLQNKLEALGFADYTPRKKNYAYAKILAEILARS